MTEAHPAKDELFKHWFHLSFLNIVLKVIYFEREKACAHAGERQRERERERDRKRFPSRLQAVSTGPDVGLHPTNRELMT